MNFAMSETSRFLKKREFRHHCEHGTSRLVLKAWAPLAIWKKLSVPTK